MIKNYACILFFILFYSNALFSGAALSAQEPQLFTRQDFDLHGDVKSCLVITDYGKEEFEFNRAGILTRSITRYNDQDYDLTYYKYQNGIITERRDESYRDGKVDKTTSIAHLYTLDTIPGRRITEKILSYNQEFLDKYEYLYDIDGNLVKVIRSNNDGIDETTIRYTAYNEEATTSYLLNGVIQKSIRTSFKNNQDGAQTKTELTKEFLEGLPIKAIEKQYDSEGKKTREIIFNYNALSKSFVPITEEQSEYDANGMLVAIVTKTGVREERKEFIYQFDNKAKGNWVKKIITPDNTYTTRRILYYPEVPGTEDGMNREH